MALQAHLVSHVGIVDVLHTEEDYGKTTETFDLK